MRSTIVEIFGILDDLVTAGKIRHYGVSVETVDQAHKALAYPGVASVQIIFNMLRRRPIIFSRPARVRWALLARLPLSSGLLTGKFRRDTVFDVDDHVGTSIATVNDSIAERPSPGFRSTTAWPWSTACDAARAPGHHARGGWRCAGS